jgi:hypothetical protein
LLDACVLLRAQDAERLPELIAAGAQARMAVAREVYREVTSPATLKPAVRARAQAARTLIDASPLEVIDLPLGSPEARLYAALRAGRSTPNDAGEAASVALAATSAKLVFVTSDKAALWLGVREAHPRVTVLPWFLRALVEAGAMGLPSAADIAKADAVGVPVWWAAWCQGQPGSAAR